MPTGELGLNKKEIKNWIAREREYISLIEEKVGHCENCERFMAGYCGHWEAEVPAEVQPTGCDNWSMDLIPF